MIEPHMSRGDLAGIIVLCSLIPLTTSAEHLPESLHATGKAETTLAGISITRDGTVIEAIQRYGEPSEKAVRRRTVGRNTAEWTDYTWMLENARLEVSASRDVITSVYVESTGPAPAVRTGAGLKLGDDLKTLEAIYGTKYREATYPHLRIGGVTKQRSERIPHTGVWENHRLTVQWRAPEYTLTAGVDDHGKIVSLELLRPECFPNECN